MLHAERGYTFEVTGAELMQSAKKGTPGFQLYLQEQENGDETTFTIWLTDAAREGAFQAFAALGVEAQTLSEATPSYVENQLPQVVVGRKVYGMVKAEEYNGKTTNKVAWIGPVRAANARGIAVSVASFFGGGAGVLEQPVADGSIPDDDIPF